MKSLIVALALCFSLPALAQDKKAEPKKAEPKKVEPKKAEPKKAVEPKAEPKKEEAPKILKRIRRKAKASAPASQPAATQPAVKAEPTTPKVQPATPKAEPKAPVAAPVAPKAEVKADAPLAQQVWWQYLVQNLMQLGFFVVSTMLSILISVLAKKYKLEGVADRVQELSFKAIHFAEQKALSAAKLNPGAPLTPSAEKMKMAVEFAVGMAKSYKVPELAEAEWEKILESAIGMQRDVVASPVNGKKE